MGVYLGNYSNELSYFIMDFKNFTMKTNWNKLSITSKILNVGIIIFSFMAIIFNKVIFVLISIFIFIALTVYAFIDSRLKKKEKKNI
jgi:hypothetical protein